MSTVIEMSLPCYQVLSFLKRFFKSKFKIKIFSIELCFREALTARVLFEVGSLSFAAPKIMTALKETEPKVLRNFIRVALRGEHRLVCLPKQTREMWGELLLSAYG